MQERLVEDSVLILSGEATDGSPDKSHTQCKCTRYETYIPN